MECPVFKEYGILYQFNELAVGEKMLYEEHLKSCEYCQAELKANQAMMDQVVQLPQVQPKAEVVHSILNAAKEHPPKVSLINPFSLFHTIRSSAVRRTWAVSLVTILVIVSFVVIHPFHAKHSIQIADSFEWEDNFASEIASIDESINRLEGYETASLDLYSNDLGREDNLSIFHEDLNDVYHEIQEIDNAFHTI